MLYILLWEPLQATECCDDAVSFCYCFKENRDEVQGNRDEFKIQRVQ